MTDIRSTEIRVIREGLVFPECPRWHDGALWFSDCHDGKVIALDLEGRIVTSFDVPGGPAGLGWLPDGSLLVVSIDDLCVYRRRPDGGLTRHADLSGVHRFHTNDMTVDAAGNAYVGEVGFRIGSEAERTTCIALVRPDGSVEATGSGVKTPNGAAITEDGKTFVVAESWIKRISAFDIDTLGKLSKQRVFAERDEREIPDGMCLDEEGCAWIASPFTNSLARVSSTEGVIDRITLPDTRPYACVFGGPDRRDLYICCAPDHDPAVVRAARGGSIMVTRPGVAGGGNP